MSSFYRIAQIWSNVATSTSGGRWHCMSALRSFVYICSIGTTSLTHLTPGARPGSSSSLRTRVQRNIFLYIYVKLSQPVLFVLPLCPPAVSDLHKRSRFTKYFKYIKDITWLVHASTISFAILWGLVRVVNSELNYTSSCWFNDINAQESYEHNYILKGSTRPMTLTLMDKHKLEQVHTLVQHSGGL